MNKKIQSLEKQIAKLETRRPEIAGDLKELEAGLKALTEMLGDAVLAGKDASHLEGEATSMAIKKSGLDAAISKCDADLARLKNELGQLQHEELAKELAAELKAVKADLHKAAQDIVAMSEDTKVWLDRLEKVRSRSHAAGLSELHGQVDHIRGNLFPFSLIQETGKYFTERQPFREDRKNRLKLLADD